MTNQEVFNFGYTAIYKQGVPSANRYGTCFYRHPDGNLKCAAGHFIPDDRYVPEMESLSILPDPERSGDVSDRYLHVQRFFESMNINLELMISIQKAHDYNARKENFLAAWNESMRKVAERFELSAEVIKD